ncbi:MAG: YegP family protein [Azonexus sp.]|nr:YegP family protein [Azonexus sp.]
MFNLKAANNQVIGTSESYETAASRDNGIESVKKNAPAAEVVEATA